MPFCRNCGKEVKDEAKFCAGCGTPTRVASGGQSPITYQQVKSAGIKPSPTVDDFDDIEKKSSNYTILIIAVVAICVAAIIGIVVMKSGTGADGKTSSAVANNTDSAQSAINQVEYQGTMVKGSKQLSIKFIVDWLPNGEIHNAYSMYTKYNVPIDLVIERGGSHCNYATPCFIENYNTDNEAAFVFNNLTANSTIVTGKWISRNNKDNVYDVRLEKSNANSTQRAELKIIHKDYKYKKSGAEFDVHLENIGNSDKIYNIINKLIYKGKNFDEYMKYTERDLIGDGDAEGYTLSEKYSIVCNNDAYMVFKYGRDEYTGGAHGNGWLTYIIIDLIGEKKLDIGDLIYPIPDNILDRIIKSKYDISYYLRDNIWPPDVINFCNKNIELVWNTYTITPYSDGMISIEIQDNIIKQYLTDKGKALRKNNSQ